jgi:hypothetical protein
MGMDVELEHGARDPETNVTDDDALTTGKIALAHLPEFPERPHVGEVDDRLAAGPPGSVPSPAIACSRGAGRTRTSRETGPRR